MRTIHREAGLEFRSSEVIHGGVPPGAFYEAVAARRSPAGNLRLLYAGQIKPDRGLHTVIEALGHLEPRIRAQVTLEVVGLGSPDHLARIKERIGQLQLGDHVVFHGKLPHEDMLRIYKNNDVLVFPSLRDEGLPLTMVEAMLAGCAVVTTGSGGAMEVATAAGLPLFPKDDGLALSRILASLATRPDEVARLAARGQEVALRDFGFDTMMARWTATLRRLHTTLPAGLPADIASKTHTTDV
jgi:spore coat protein SA